MEQQSENEKLDVLADPLFVCSMYYGETKFYEYNDTKISKKRKTTRYAISIAPDIVMKAGYSGGAGSVIFFPDPAIDAVIKKDEHLRNSEKEINFVEYLRNCFR